jgi:hypothetical protein
MSESDVKTISWPVFGLLFLVNLIAISFFFSPGTGDVGTWARWMREIDAGGLIGGYAQSDTDYPPLSFVLLASVSRTATALEISRFIVLKCSILVFLFATAGCFYLFTRNLLLAVALELGLVLNSVALGYLDIYFAPFLITGFFLLQRGHLTTGLLLFAISCSIKWQPLIVAPFVCTYVFAGEKQETREKNRPWTKRLIPFLFAAALAVAFLLIFGAKIFDSLERAMTRHAFLSGYALNLGWIQTWALNLLSPEKYPPSQTGAIDAVIVRDAWIVWPNKLLFYASYLAILFAFVRQTKTFTRLIVYSMLGYLAYFSFNTGVHENHLFLICCLAWILVWLDGNELIRAINLTLAANANLFLFFGAFGQRLNPVFAGIDVTLVFAVANLCLFAGFLVHTFKADAVSFRFRQSREP